jgi:F420-non-reducing hydrogenase small subunit
VTTARTPKVAFAWLASCGGCEEVFLDLGEGLLDLAAAVEVVFWPAVLDYKLSALERLADGAVDVAFVNGAVATEDHFEIAHLLRRKAKKIVAFGACAHLGGVPGLANLTTRREILRVNYLESPTVVNPTGTLPSPTTAVDGHALPLPALWSQVHALGQVVDVDLVVPGCAPTPALAAAALEAVLSGATYPKGAVLAPDRALCETCPRRSTRTPGLRLAGFARPHEIAADPHICFLEQGLLCCGPATRGGCGETCIAGNMPCTGCFGPVPGVEDHGARLLGAVATLVAARTADGAATAAQTVVDPAGTFFRYSLPSSLLAAKPDAERGGTP